MTALHHKRYLKLGASSTSCGIDVFFLKIEIKKFLNGNKSEFCRTINLL